MLLNRLWLHVNDHERKGFGYENTKCAILPCKFAGEFVAIRTEVVNSNIPLLLSNNI